MPRRLLFVCGLLAVAAAAVWRPWRAADPLAGFPTTVLFADDRTEDLRFLNTETTAVAFLSRTVILGATGITVRPRLAALHYPRGTVLMAVARIESAVDPLPPRANVIRELLPAAAAAAALQIDFDAADAERYWYYSLLTDLRRELPPEKPLSIAVRPSWCDTGGWIDGLPVGEACPLLFRGSGEIALPLCGSSAGLWAGDRSPKVRRLYWFHPLPWTAEAYEKLAVR